MNVQMYLICRVVTSLSIKFCNLEKDIQIKALDYTEESHVFYQHGVADTQQYQIKI